MNKNPKQNKASTQTKDKKVVIKDENSKDNKNRSTSPIKKTKEESKKPSAPKSSAKSTEKSDKSKEMIQNLNEINQKQLSELVNERSRNAELEKKIKQQEDRIRKEQEDKRKQSDILKKDIEEKEKVILSLATNNKRLMIEMEEIKKEIDEKFDKIGFREVHEKQKIKAKKQNPIEIVLKVKEKELKNAISLIDILRKDNENLKKTLNEKSDYNKVLELEDRLKVEVQKNQNVALELKKVQKIASEHEKCLNNEKNNENDIKNYVSELRYSKNLIKELQNKIKEEESKNSKTMDKLISMKNELDNHKSFLPDVNPSLSNKMSIKNLTSQPNSLNKYFAAMDPNNKKQSKEQMEFLKNNEKYNNIAISKSIKTLRNDSKDLEKNKLSRSLGQIKGPRYPNTSEERQSLLNAEERKLFEKLLPKIEMDKIVKRFDTVDYSKTVLERKYQTETKAFNKKLNDLEERIDLLTVQNKETEQKNKILSYQNNELETKNKMLNKKFKSMTDHIKKLEELLRTKEEENKINAAQLEQMKKNVEDGGNQNSRSYNDDDSNRNDDDDNEEENEDDDEEHNDDDGEQEDQDDDDY